MLGGIAFHPHEEDVQVLYVWNSSIAFVGGEAFFDQNLGAKKI